MTDKRSRSRGFSLLELMITITVMAILLAIAVPSLRDVIHRNEVSSASNALLASVSYARAEAITRGQLVSMCPGDETGCTSGSQVFDRGWIVYTYPAGAASANKAYVSGTSILLRATGARTGVSIQSKTGTVITFGLQGQLEPSLQTLVFATCYRSADTGTGTITTAVPGVELDVNGSGSVTTKAATTCSPS